jgi:hypothetical protein
MTFLARLKRIAWIVAGGITGAFLLIGAGLILALVIEACRTALSHFGGGQSIDRWERTWTMERVYAFFAGVGMVGFAVGLLTGWKNQPFVRKFFIPTLVYAIPLTLLFWLLFASAGNVMFPREVKITDCTNDMLTVHFTIPKGRNYRLILATPWGASNESSLRFNIANGALTITNFTLDAIRGEKQCGFFQPQISYDIMMKCDPHTPRSSSVSLRWLQAYKDRNK